MSSIQTAYDELQKGRLVVLTDDLHSPYVSYFIGALDKVDTELVNFMIKVGKGLVYAGISREQAKRLNLPFMSDRENQDGATVSVDHMTSTTGISAYERAVTLRELNKKEARPEHFIRPGHVFPITYASHGLLERRSVIEAAAEAAGHEEKTANTVLCELLNEKGEIANTREVQHLCYSHNLHSVTVSKLFKEKRRQYLTSFTAETTNIPYVNHAIGFPNIKVNPSVSLSSLRSGVYGIRVTCEQHSDIGILHVNDTEKEGKQKILDMYTGKLKSKSLNNKLVRIDVVFYLRPLKYFSSSSIEELVSMYKSDNEEVRQIFDLLDQDEKTKGRCAL